MRGFGARSQVVEESGILQVQRDVKPSRTKTIGPYDGAEVTTGVLDVPVRDIAMLPSKRMPEGEGGGRELEADGGG